MPVLRDSIATTPPREPARATPIQPFGHGSSSLLHPVGEIIYIIHLFVFRLFVRFLTLPFYLQYQKRSELFQTLRESASVMKHQRWYKDLRQPSSLKEIITIDNNSIRKSPKFCHYASFSQYSIWFKVVKEIWAIYWRILLLKATDALDYGYREYQE